MAASNKPTGVHVSLIIFVMSTIIFGVMWYMEMGERKGAQAEASKKAADLQTVQTEKSKRDDEVKAVVAKYGINTPDNIGFNAQEGQVDNVLGGMDQDLKTYAKDLAKQTVRMTLAELSQKINTLTQEKNNLQAQLGDSQAKVLSLEKEMQARVDQYALETKNQTGRAEKATVDLDEAIKSKNVTIDGLQKQLSDERVASEATQDRLQKQIDKITRDLEGLTSANNKLQDDLQAAKQYSFEVPDGEIRWVDHATKLVWINLGEADRLPKKTSFSVYTKAHHGVARGSADVKGAIEVTRILGPHLAEARILQSDDLRPIAVGDPIYTPLWSAGMVERFAILGKIDFDGDGHDDRGRLHELINAAGAKIESEVDDKGVLHGPGVTVRTRFLVVGEIPSPQSVQLQPEEVEASNKMMELHKDMIAQARQQGVRVVSLNDFLNYIGYTSTRRMWAPGEGRPYGLKSNAPALGIDETVPDRNHALSQRKVGGRGARVIESQQKEAEKANQSQNQNEDKK